MEQKTAHKLVSENLKKIYAYSLSRLYDKESAEDLTNDIVCEILKSVGRLQNDSAFYGFMWKIADNTFKKFIRRKTNRTLEFDEDFVGAYWETPEDIVCHTEEINTLRREMSLLTSQYREVTVSHYIYGKSRSEISRILQISQEMVKYYLFKTRKILKEGFDMTREYGEKSYNPGTFGMDYWGGGDNSRFYALFKRKLPGNILLAAYYEPMTLRDLSVELGVAVPYLEDEVEILIQNEVMKKPAINIKRTSSFLRIYAKRSGGEDKTDLRADGGKCVQRTDGSASGDKEAGFRISQAKRQPDYLGFCEHSDDFCPESS